MRDAFKDGETLFAEGKVDEAEKRFLEILQSDSGRKEAHNNLGVIAFEKKDMARAAAFFEAALRIDPAYRDSLDNLQAVREIGTDSDRDPGHDTFPERSLTGARLAIVNTFDNKFNDIYRTYFAQNNQVKVITPRSVQDLTEVAAWADVVWSTWCNEATVHLSRLANCPPLATNIRSYEILTPDLMSNVNWSRVDGALFVADHIRELANTMWPDQLSEVTQATVYNCVELDRYPLYQNGPGTNICYVGYLNHKKGLSLLLQCVREAVRLDPAFKLHVAGDFQEDRFRVYMHHLLGEMGLADNVQFHGWVKDVPAFLADMNYVISTSPWEGCPYNLIEAMACGIKPLIHNWKGSRQLFPESLVFNTLDDFWTLLKSSDYDSDSYRRHVEVNFSTARNMPRIDAFLASLLAARKDDRRTIQDKPATIPAPHEVPDKAAAPATPASAADPSETINYLQPLDKGIGFIDNRKQFTVDFCRGKRVLHIGCVDSGIMEQRILENNFLHHHIGRVAGKLVGADVDEKGLARLKQAGYEVHTMDLERDTDLLRELSADADVIVIPEVIEHLSNAGLALQNLKDCDFHGDILISTPNAFSWRAHKMLAENVELVHPDHNCYYSATTLTTLLRKHGFRIERLLMYYWPSDDAIGREFVDMLRACPYYGEGIIAVVNADNQPSA